MRKSNIIQQLREVAYCLIVDSNILHIPEHPDGDSGNIRTRNRMHPDTLPASLIVK